MGGKSEKGNTQNIPEPTVTGLPENSMTSRRSFWEVRCAIASKKARLKLFRGVLDAESSDTLKNIYIEDAGLIAFAYLRPKELHNWILDPHKKIKWGKEEKSEALRRLDLDHEVAQRFLKVGLLRDLINIEQEELDSLLFGPTSHLSEPSYLNPEFKKLVEKLKAMETAGLPNQTANEINKHTILDVGQVFISGHNSVWIVDHHYFGADCNGRVHLVAQKEDEDAFRSTGNSCSGCMKSLPELINISFPRSRLEKKIHDDSLREKIPDYKS